MTLGAITARSPSPYLAGCRRIASAIHHAARLDSYTQYVVSNGGSGRTYLSGLIGAAATDKQCGIGGRLPLA